MFEQAVLSSGSSGRRVWMTSASMLGQAAMGTLAVLGALLWPEALPKVQLTLLAPPAPVGSQANQVVAHPRQSVPAPKPFDLSALTQPTRAPDRAATIIDAPPETGGLVGGGGLGSSDKAIGDILGVPSTAVAAAPPRTEPAEREKAQPKANDTAPIQRVRQGGVVAPPQILRMVQPIYPGIARTAHISGAVELSGVIGADGRVRELRVVKGHPLLTKAALDAVAQWIYAPTRLNGDIVEVITNITVTFKLD